jgi:K+-sensing histidine kinase KdpD
MTSDRLTADISTLRAPRSDHEWPYRRSAAKRYSVAVLAVLLAFAARYVIYGDLQNRLVFTFFVPAAMVAVWYGGVGPGILATVLGMLFGDFFFMQARFALWPLGVRASMAIGGYAVTTMLCVMWCERLHSRIRHFEHALDHAWHQHSIKLHADAQEFADYLIHYYSRADHRIYAYNSWPFRRSFAMRYGMAVGVVMLAFVLRYWLFGTQDHRFPFLFFVPAAMTAAWFGGMAPGLLATAAGLVLGDYFFLSEHQAMGAVAETERISIGLYAVMTTLCVMLFENLHDRIRRLEHAFDHARHRRPMPLTDASAPGSSAVAPR